MRQPPRDTVRDAIDDEPTAVELPELLAPTYDAAPPTIESRPSPFHRVESLQRTAPGMPPPVAFDPKITSAPATPMVPPIIVGAPAEDLAGPTDPYGTPISGSWDTPTDPGLGAWIDSGPTDPVQAMPRPKPVVPPPGSPTFEISQSLELDAASARAARAAAKPKPQPRRHHHHVPQAGPGPHAPTYQMLPALSRKEPKRRESDWPLIFGLLGLAVVIAGLVGAVAYGVARSVHSAPASTSAEQPSNQ